MRTILAVVLALAPVSAHAERTTTVNLGGWFGGFENTDEEAQTVMAVSGGPRLTLGWEHAPIALPPTPGYAADVGLVPEITGGLVLGEDRGEALLGVGVRGELRIGQRDGGLLRVNARIAVYLAARALVVGKDQDPAFEAVLGEYLYLGKGRTRLGGEFNILTRRDSADVMDHDKIGVFASVYVGWAM